MGLHLTGSSLTALNNAYARRWQATTAYTAGDRVLSPNTGRVMAAKTTFTSGSTYDPTKWTPVDGRFPVAEYGAKGDGTTDDTAAIALAFAQIPTSGGVVDFPTGLYQCANLTLNKSNVSLVFAEGARLQKNANGPVLSWGSGGSTKLEFQGLRIDGNGGTYTGAGLVINGGTWPRLRGGEVIDTASNPLQFSGDGSGHSARVSDMTLYPYDSAVGGANATVGAIALPADTGAPNRHFNNIHTGSALLFDDAGSQDSNFVNCTGRNVKYSGAPAKQYMVSCRLPTSGAAVTLTGAQCVWVGNSIAGAVTLDANAGNCAFTGNTVAGNLTVAAGAAGNAVGPNALSGSFTDLGTRTNVVGSQVGTYLPPHSVDPRMLSGTQTLNANQGHYYRVKGRGYISKIGLHVSTSSGNICVGVYGSNTSTGVAAAPSTQKATSGSVACPIAGYAEVALTSSVYVEEGDWIALAADNATAAFYRGPTSNGFGSNFAKGLVQVQSSAFPLPATPGGSQGSMYSIILTGVA